MRRSLLTALLILLTAGVIAMGAPADDAKRAATAADKKLAAAGAQLQALAKSFAQHLTAIADVTRQLEQYRERQKQAAPLIAKALDAVDADLAAAKVEASAAQRRLREAEAAAKQARDEVGPKRAAVERAASEERKAFEASDEFRQASAKVDAANVALSREQARLDATLKNDPTIAPLLAAATKAEAEVTAARTKSPADDVAVAEASAQWIEAKNALAIAQAAAYGEDAKFVEAQKAATAALAARTALSDAFDKSILGQPGVAEAQLALRDANNAVKLAEASLSNAREAVARAGRWLISRRASADAIARIVRDADEGLLDALADLKRAQNSARDLGREVSEVATEVLAVRDDVKRVAAAAAAAASSKTQK